MALLSQKGAVMLKILSHKNHKNFHKKSPKSNDLGLEVDLNDKNLKIYGTTNACWKDNEFSSLAPQANLPLIW